MQSILKEPIIGEDLSIEIRSRFSPSPTPNAELERLRLSLLKQSRLLHITGGSGRVEVQHLAPLIDPVVEELIVGEGKTMPDVLSVDVFCRPGVTDAEGEMAALALQLAGIPEVRCHAGTRYRFAGPVPSGVRPEVERLLGNPLIRRFVWSDEVAPGFHASRDEATEPRIAGALALGVAAGDGAASSQPAASEQVERIDLDGRDDEELRRISKRCNLALDLEEMRAAAAYFAGLGRAPTDVELQSIASTWSEHCCHKTFKATIDFLHDGRWETVPGLLRACIAAPTAELNLPWVRSAFDDNAGVIAFDDTHDLAFKVETHNHPSALEPFGGAHTGVGGVIRDVLAVSAEPIANTDVLCFGPLDLPYSALPPGVFHPRTTYRGVVRGVADYGNNMGIPTVGGAVVFHPGYTANPLVYCGTLGLAPHGSHPRLPKPGDAVVLLGGRTGRDGLHGATMSSASLDREGVEGSTVQIGAPITEKTVRDVLPHLRDERLYHAITDCGAGGLCSAVGEMGAQLGLDVDLARVPLKYDGLRPWEIWLSEAQERMVLAVPEEHVPRVFQICRAYDVEATVLGRFRDDGRLRLLYGGDGDRGIVADMDMGFLHEGRPPRRLQARWNTSQPQPYAAGDGSDLDAALLTLLAHPTIASKEEVIRRYDHEVGGGTVIKPLVGRAGPSDAAVLQPLPESYRGVVVSHGINPLYGELDPHAMAMLAVDEALRNLVAVGGSLERAALLDNFCWGDVDDPEELGALVRAAQGCRDAALAYGVPFISGKDSLRNTSVDEEGEHSIPRTLLISAVGVVPDVRQTTTMDLKEVGSALYLLGRTGDELGGSHYLDIRGEQGGNVPRARPEQTRRVMQGLTEAIHQDLVHSCHDLSEGGLAVAAAEMALAGGLGLEIDLTSNSEPISGDAAGTEALLFAESGGRFLVEVPQEKRARFEELFIDLPCAEIGKTTEEPRFVIRRSEVGVIDLTVDEIEQAWRRTLSPSPSPVRGRGEPCAQHTKETSPFDAGPGQPYSTGCGAHAQAAVLVPPLPHTGEARAGAPDRAAVGVRAGVRAMVLAAPGVNCDRETVEACRLAGAEVELVHLNALLDGERRLADFGMLVLPGGFSYGDHLGAGAMLATVLRYRLREELERFVADGRPVLGICNGFQVLTRLGLLGDVALVPNIAGSFECRWVPLRVERSPSPFLEGLETLELPIAHGQGRVVLGGEETGYHAPLRYVENPNGSMEDIAGVCNPQGNVFGLMPHPERYVHRYQHPGWHRLANHGSPSPGLVLFQNAVRYVRETVW